MKNTKKRHALTYCVLLFIMMLIATPLVVSNFFLPSEIKLIVGEEHHFNFDLPLKANILKGNNIIIKDDAEQFIESHIVNLNRSLYVTMPEEGETDVTLSFLGIIPLKTVSVKALSYQTLIPSGDIVGIKVETNGVMVLGVGEFETEDATVSPCKDIIEAGDIILKCNGKVVENKEAFRALIESSSEKEALLEISHKGEIKQVKVKPLYSKSEDEYKIGLWIKDSTQGIGTITYINPENGHFGALGHGITDTQTRILTPVRTGEIMEVFITKIKKGEKGTPGELSGIIDYNEESQLGKICLNSSLGIYGEVKKSYLEGKQNEALPIAFQDEVHEGKASIMLNLTGEGSKEYEVEIQKVSKYSNEPSKGMVIRIVDEALLSLTNGIVQGMSGSPILQDGKIIGAVTHVFVHDPTRGYGIFIENMINNY
ncbi:MAG: SpoIVB peptidase [Cellulosilyticum sp.]|nr:SpoIVB peptidase [Cellulosilyticum sp.]